MEKLKKIARELVPDVVEDLAKEKVRKMLKDTELLTNVEADSKKTLGLSTKDLKNPANSANEFCSTAKMLSASLVVLMLFKLLAFPTTEVISLLPGKASSRLRASDML